MDGGTLIERLERLDVRSLSTSQVVEATRSIRRLRGFLDAKEGELSRRAQELHEKTGGLPPEDVLASHGRSSRREAEKTRRHAEVLGDAPAMNESCPRVESVRSMQTPWHRWPAVSPPHNASNCCRTRKRWPKQRPLGHRSSSVAT